MSERFRLGESQVVEPALTQSSTASQCSTRRGLESDGVGDEVGGGAGEMRRRRAASFADKYP